MPDNNQQNNNTAVANLFASLDDEQTPIRRIPLTNQTGVACRNLNRNFIGIELDEKYFKIAQDRISAARG